MFIDTASASVSHAAVFFLNRDSIFSCNFTKLEHNRCIENTRKIALHSYEERMVFPQVQLVSASEETHRGAVDHRRA
jgi:hypothetical protein